MDKQNGKSVQCNVIHCYKEMSYHVIKKHGGNLNALKSKYYYQVKGTYVKRIQNA